MCVASSNAAAAAGDAAQAAFDRKNLTLQERNPRPASSRHRVSSPGLDPAVTRAPQHVADIASCRNAQRMSAKALQHEWKHEVQIALLRRRATMIRVVIPSISAREQRLVASLMDGAASHSVQAPPARWRRRRRRRHRNEHHSTRR